METEIRAGTARLALYQALRETALAQRAALEAEDLDAFHELMVERETMIAEIEQLESESIDPSARTAATALLREILTLDDANQTLLAAQIEATQRELGLIRTGQQVLHTYSHLGPEPAARFVDRRT